MFLRRLLRLVGALLTVAGLLLLIYAGVNYAQASLAEKQAEANIPGQAPEIAAKEPTGQPSLSTDTPTGATVERSLPTDTAATQTVQPIPTTDTATATLLPPPTRRASPTESSGTMTTTLDTVVGPLGLARGQGADPTRLVVPRLQLDTRIKEATWAVVDENGTPTSEWQIPYDAVAHLSTTPKPGEAGNAVISGHHNLIGPNVFGLGKFAGLWNLKAGDPVYIFDSAGRIFLYDVATYYTLKELGEPLSVREVHAQQILKDSTTPVVTFETCWNGALAPLSGNTYRWVVVAELVGTVFPVQVPSVAKN